MKRPGLTSERMSGGGVTKGSMYGQADSPTGLHPPWNFPGLLPKKALPYSQKPLKKSFCSVFRLKMPFWPFGPHWILCSSICGLSIGLLLINDPCACYWYIIKCANHPKNHPNKDTNPSEKAFGTLFYLKPFEAIREACNSLCVGLNCHF